MDVPDLDLPRSVALALWLQDLGPASAADPPQLGSTLAELVAAWAVGARTVAAVLPAPGDPAGVPAVVGHLAARAGECVLVRTGTGSYAAIPTVEEFGSVYEPGHLVRWEVSSVPEWQTAIIREVGSLADAVRRSRSASASATCARRS